MKRRDLTAEELALWKRAMRNTTPLPGREDEAEDEVAPPPVPPRRTSPAPAQGQAQRPQRPAEGRELNPAEPPPASALQSGVDAATGRRLRRGRMTVEASCDLHGMRQEEAHGALNRFIAESQAAGRRCVLVITGKGGRPAETGEAAFMQRQGDGVLRRQAPHWLRLEPNASRVFAIESAHARHGGAGALYVFLRKAKKGPAT